jgi:hypothetical protein
MWWRKDGRIILERFLSGVGKVTTQQEWDAWCTKCRGEDWWDWRANGIAIFLADVETHEKFGDNPAMATTVGLIDSRFATDEPYKDPDPAFAQAVHTYVEHGDSAALHVYLASDRPLNVLARHILANAMRPPPQPKERGRPRDLLVRTMEHLASEFYRAWRVTNDREGVPDYGHRQEMMEICAEYVVKRLAEARSNADLFAQSMPMPADLFANTVAAVLAGMNRPRGRRGDRDDLRLLKVTAKNPSERPRKS